MKQCLTVRHWGHGTERTTVRSHKNLLGSDTVVRREEHPSEKGSIEVQYSQILLCACNINTARYLALI